MKSTSYITLSRKALRHNINYVHKIFKGGPKITMVVKGNAYGHNTQTFCRMAFEEGIRHFSVYSAYEAEDVYDVVGEHADIMIMGYAEGEGLEWAVKHGIESYFFDMPRLHEALKYAKKYDVKVKAHLELETGMHRTGLEKRYWKNAIRFLTKNADYFELYGLCTHYAGSESISNDVRVQNQKKVFRSAVKTFKEEGLEPKYVHSCCSAAAIRYPEMHDDLLRIGIMFFGFWPSGEILIEHQNRIKKRVNPLKRIISWRSHVMSLKRVKTGEFIGYGTTYMAHKHMHIAIVPIGYAHGFSRILSNQGRVLIHGERLPVVGVVNMNCLAVDVSLLEGVKKGDEVTIIGKQGDMELTVSAFTNISDQVNYEMLARLPERIPRYVID